MYVMIYGGSEPVSRFAVSGEIGGVPDVRQFIILMNAGIDVKPEGYGSKRGSNAGYYVFRWMLFSPAHSSLIFCNFVLILVYGSSWLWYVYCIICALEGVRI
jgi:hypothetical protein